jgi:AcrR family transcriptional regulator
MHIVKEGEVRKAEFIEAAIGLFLQKGFDKTSINDIIAKVGVTKGSFYYYFESKEALLDEIVNQVTGALIGETRARMEDDRVPLDQRLLQADLALVEYRKSESRNIKNFNEILINTNNAKLIHKAGRILKEGMLPVFVKFISQGKEQGIFNPPDVSETAEVVLMLHQTFHKKVSHYFNQCCDTPPNREDIRKSTVFYQTTVGNILGAPNALATLTEKILQLIG